MWDLDGAQRWDKWKQEKYGGKQKAKSMVTQYLEQETLEELYEAEKAANEAIAASASPIKLSWKKWFARLFSRIQ